MSALTHAKSILGAAIAVFVSASTAQAATAHPALRATTTKAFTDGPSPNGGLPLLFDQSGSPSFEGILAMTNLDPGQEDFDTELADDFNVPSGGWAIATVRLGTFFHAVGTPVRPSTSGNIAFHYDSAGRPGEAIPGCTHRNIPLFYSEPFLTSVLNLPEVCALPAGRYWMSFSGNLSFADQQGGAYVTQENTSPNGTIVWRNPRGGYGAGCGDWSTPTTCGLAGNGGMTFQLYGQTTPVSLQSFSVD